MKTLTIDEAEARIKAGEDVLILSDGRIVEGKGPGLRASSPLTFEEWTRRKEARRTDEKKRVQELCASIGWRSVVHFAFVCASEMGSRWAGKTLAALQKEVWEIRGGAKKDED